MSTLRIAPDPSEGLTQRVAEEVRALMGRQRITQTRIAEVLDIPQSSVSSRLRGSTPFRLPELERLAELFGVHLAVLLGLPAPGPTPPDGTTPGGPERQVTRWYPQESTPVSDAPEHMRPPSCVPSPRTLRPAA